MPQLVTVSGKVSHVSQTSSTHGQVQNGHGTVSTSHQLSFRVDNRPATMKGTPSIGDGDLVTIAGLDRGGIVETLAVRNRSTGIDYGGAKTVQYIAAGICGLLGVVTLPLAGFGLLLIGLAAWAVRSARRDQSALEMVQRAA